MCELTFELNAFCCPFGLWKAISPSAAAAVMLNLRFWGRNNNIHWDEKKHLEVVGAEMHYQPDWNPSSRGWAWQMLYYKKLGRWDVLCQLLEQY